MGRAGVSEYPSKSNLLLGSLTPSGRGATNREDRHLQDLMELLDAAHNIQSWNTNYKERPCEIVTA